MLFYLYNRVNIIINNSLSNYERLILGLPIDKNLYAELDHMRLSLKFPDNFETYIKKSLCSGGFFSFPCALKNHRPLELSEG